MVKNWHEKISNLFLLKHRNQSIIKDNDSIREKKREVELKLNDCIRQKY